MGNWKREVVIIFARLGTSERQTSTPVLQQKKKKKKDEKDSGEESIEGMMKIHKRDN